MGVGEDAEAEAGDGGDESGRGGGGLVCALPGHGVVGFAVGDVYFDDGVVDLLVFFGLGVFLGGGVGGCGIIGRVLCDFSVVVAVGSDFPLNVCR